MMVWMSEREEVEAQTPMLTFQEADLRPSRAKKKQTKKKKRSLSDEVE